MRAQIWFSNASSPGVEELDALDESARLVRPHVGGHERDALQTRSPHSPFRVYERGHHARGDILETRRVTRFIPLNGEKSGHTAYNLEVELVGREGEQSVIDGVQDGFSDLK